MVINKATETHKGSGFVKFKDGKIAKHLIEESKKFEQTNWDSVVSGKIWVGPIYYNSN